MKNKINQLLKEYNSSLKLKERRIEEYIDIKNSDNGFKNNLKAELEYTRLYNEIGLLKKIIGDLEWILEE
ncbi:hypothetical protein [Clostridium botulinum]|uniref:hypothetical protein n=1 Tax=Clostridium botulinum TaxID=1491 RepID=UPI0004AE43E6|nr:hypothetical protein [Clostridium botulinum]QDY27024.1 hypothetical protein CGQ40_20180 [Clostridium botulinum]